MLTRLVRLGPVYLAPVPLYEEPSARRPEPAPRNSGVTFSA